MNKERRTKERLECVLPLRVQGTGNEGKIFRFETVARDIGAGGLCAYAPQTIRPGQKLSMRVRFARPGRRAVQAPEFSVRGRVVRAKERPGGLCMFAVSFLISTFHLPR